MKVHSFDYPLIKGLFTPLSNRLLLNFGTNWLIIPSKPRCKQLRSQKHYLKLGKSLSACIEKGKFITKSLKREEKYNGA